MDEPTLMIQDDDLLRALEDAMREVDSTVLPQPKGPTSEISPLHPLSKEVENPSVTSGPPNQYSTTLPSPSYNKDPNSAVIPRTNSEASTSLPPSSASKTVKVDSSSSFQRLKG